jgi:hypothetical protein
VRPGLVLQAFFSKFVENNFEASFSRLKKVCDVFASRFPLGKSPAPTLEKSHLKSLSDFGKKITEKTYKTKPVLPNKFSLCPKETWEIF